MNHLSVDQFIEHVRHMPDIEARQEIEKRLDSLSLQMSLIQSARAELNDTRKDRAEHAKLGVELQIIASDNGRLRRMLKETNQRMERINWAKAVTALYGQEGFSACREWMAVQYEREMPR